MGDEPIGTDEGSKRRPGLAVVATPIGNLGDITARAVAALRQADLIACEDTRVTAKLLRAHGIETPMTPYHEHNAERARPVLIQRMERGEAVALVSDAGTPLVSDPGFKLVREAVERGLPVTALPGASAPLAALVLAGLPTDRFLFAGFLPPKTKGRRDALAELAGWRATLVFFESPARLADSLADMEAVLGDRPAAVCRELTKLHEEVRRGPLSELAGHYAAAGPPKGEVVLVVGPPDAPEPAGKAELDAQLGAALAEASLKDAVALVAAGTGLPRKTVYARALALQKERGG